MTVIDYNGSGVWSVEEVLRRYAVYAQRYGIATPRDLNPLVHSDNDKQWIYPVMDRVIEGIEKGDQACVELGVEFIEDNSSFVFGRILKIQHRPGIAPIVAYQRAKGKSSEACCGNA